MSFILKYLDEALDNVTGRYDEHDEEDGSEVGSAMSGADGDEGEGERRPLGHPVRRNSCTSNTHQRYQYTAVVAESGTSQTARRNGV